MHAYAQPLKHMQENIHNESSRREQAYTNESTIISALRILLTHKGSSLIGCLYTPFNTKPRPQ